MPETIEDRIRFLLDGQPFDNDVPVALGTKEIESSFVPVTQETVTYVVVAVVINDKGETLMVQEANASCRGKWYLPAGRVNPNETLIEAVKREVMEETYLQFEPRTLLLVEYARGLWFEFLFTGEITGGSIKTLDQADEESLQAAWILHASDLPLRSRSVHPLIARVKNSLNRPLQHPNLLPVSRSLSKLLLRLLIVTNDNASGNACVLLSGSATPHLPVCEINRNRKLLWTLRNFIEEIFGDRAAHHSVHGLLSVEFSGGNGGDGLCLTQMVSYSAPFEDLKPIDKYYWHRLPESLAADIKVRIPEYMTVPLLDVC